LEEDCHRSPIDPKGDEVEKGAEVVVEWQELVEGVHQGEGHFIGVNREGSLVQAHFVNVGDSEEGRHTTSPSRRPRHPLAAQGDVKDRFQPGNLTERKWREFPATANERQTIVRVGRQLEQRGISAREVAKRFNLAASTYSTWKKKAGNS
jgi:hypothetical protein